MTLALPLAGIAPHPDAAKSQWWSPLDLATRIATWAGIGPGTRVLEPSAGLGALAHAARNLGGKVFCVELDPALVEHLRADDFEVLCSDFLLANLGEYDVALMNPPFEDGQTEQHILHALQFAPRVVCIAQLGVLAGVERKAQLWDRHSLASMVVLSRRPKFSGASSTAMRDFGVFEICRGRQAMSTHVEWW